MLDSLQLTASQKVATPVNWKVIVLMLFLVIILLIVHLHMYISLMVRWRVSLYKA